MANQEVLLLRKIAEEVEIRQVALFRSVLTRQSSASRKAQLRSLARRGLIEYSRDLSGERPVYVCRITPKGRREASKWSRVPVA